jgi:hypothetical protein
MWFNEHEIVLFIFYNIGLQHVDDTEITVETPLKF